MLLKHLWTFKVLADQGPFTGHFLGGLIFPRSSWLSNEAALSPVCTSRVLMLKEEIVLPGTGTCPVLGTTDGSLDGSAMGTRNSSVLATGSTVCLSTARPLPACFSAESASDFFWKDKAVIVQALLWAFSSVLWGKRSSSHSKTSLCSA